MTRLCTSYIYSCFRYTHGVLHDAVFDNESGEGWKQAAESFNLPYLDVIQIASHDVYSTWIANSEIHESGAILVRPDGYVAWRYDSTNDQFDYENTLKTVLKQIQLTV